MIIGISGKMGTGKTTLAKMLGGNRVSFAGELRLEVSAQFGLPLDAMSDPAMKETLVVPMGFKYMKLREVMQWYGALRRETDPDYWVKRALQYDDCIIDDVRYRNEADAIRAQGGVLIRLEPYPEWKSGIGADHPSETDLDDYQHFTGIFHPAYGDLETCADIILQHLGEE